MFVHIYISSLSKVALAVVVACIAVYAFYKLSNKFKFQKYIFLFGFVVYILMIVYETVLSRQPSNKVVGLSLIPFETYRKAATINAEYYREAFMNVVFFVPLGFLYGCLDIEFFKKRKWLIILNSCSSSIVIEFIQYVFKLGFAEIDDVIHNTLGATIGILLFLIFEVVTKLILKFVKQNK